MEGVFKCKNCGNTINLSKAVNGVIECEYCKSIFTVPKTNVNGAALDFLRIGEHNSDMGKFDESYTAYAKAAEYDKEESEAYWGMALAEFKVQYIKDAVNNRLQPICHEITDKSFAENKNYKAAIKYATAIQKSEYQKKAKEIDYIRSEFYKLKQSGLDYDCFICVKVTKENHEHTEDSHIASKLYHEIIKAGYKPFYSEEEARGRAGADYEALILYALYCSKSMIVVCCNEQYLLTPWVKNEYTRFLSLLNDGEKQNDSITIVYKNSPVEKLPGRAGKIEGIDYGEGDALLRVFNFLEKHKTASLREIKRKEYGGTAYAKKKAVRQGVTKRQLTMVRGGEISVSERAQMNVAAEFLARRDFANAVRQCDIILSKNPANSDIHWLHFLAEHSCVNDEAYISDFNGASKYEHLEKAIASANDKDKQNLIYDVLINRIVKRKDILAYKEYIVLPDSTEENIALLTDEMFNYALQTSNQHIFNEIIKTVTDTDKYIIMNLAFAQKVTPQSAVQFYKSILSVDEGHGEALYKMFAARHGYSDEAVFEYCCKAENFKEMDEALFAYGYNGAAVSRLYYACLSNLAQRPEDCSRLFDYVLSTIPKSENEKFIRFLREFVSKLFDCGNVKYAEKYNELLLTADNLDHGAYFNRVLLKNGFSNPLELVKISDILIDDPDYFSAVTSYTERNPVQKNLYLDINDAVKELKQILNSPRRLEYALKNVIVSKEQLIDCKQQVLESVENADHTSFKYKLQELRKTAIFNTPTILLIIFALTVIATPQVIFKNIHYGWIIPIDVVGFLALLVVGSLTVKKSLKADNKYVRLHLKQYGVVMALGAVVFAILLSCGLGFAYKNTYHLSTAEDFKIIENLPSAESSNYIVDNDIDFNGKSYGFGCLESFRGSFDGQGYSLLNVEYKNTTSKNADNRDWWGFYDNDFGLVRYNRGIIKNLTIVDSKFTFIGNKECLQAVVAHENKGIIENCYVNNSVANYYNWAWYDESAIAIVCYINNN